MKGEVAELVRDDALRLIRLAAELPFPEHFNGRTLRIGKRDQLGDGGLGVLLVIGLDPVLLDLPCELVEIRIGGQAEMRCGCTAAARCAAALRNDDRARSPDRPRPPSSR